jgi:hypothetical protein
MQSCFADFSIRIALPDLCEKFQILCFRLKLLSKNKEDVHFAHYFCGLYLCQLQAVFGKHVTFALCTSTIPHEANGFKTIIFLKKKSMRK